MKTEIIQAILDNKTVQYESRDYDNSGVLIQVWKDLCVSDKMMIYCNAKAFANLFTDDVFPLWRIKSEDMQYEN